MSRVYVTRVWAEDDPNEVEEFKSDSNDRAETYLYILNCLGWRVGETVEMTEEELEEERHD